jgi:hypothetical protein
MTKTIKNIEIDPDINGYENFIQNFNEDVGSGKHVFLFLFMDGCGPCNETKPQWKKIHKLLKKYNKSQNYDDLVVASINQKLFDKLNGTGAEPMGYPCLRYIKGPKIEEYEDSNVKNKDRTAESFINWIESKIKKQSGGKRVGVKYVGERKTQKQFRGGKWSLKYKKSINCRRPKGFSQKQHCKYGRKTRKSRY